MRKDPRKNVHRDPRRTDLRWGLLAVALALAATPAWAGDAGPPACKDADGDGLDACKPGDPGDDGKPQDCDDKDPHVAPNAPEICNGRDDNCDGKVDEGHDQDHDGFTWCAGDCDDTNGAAHPGVPEVCDAVDNDCDRLVDEDFDLDRDGWSTCNGDCADDDDTIHPAAGERCDGLDQNCNGVIDEGGVCVEPEPECGACVGGVSELTLVFTGDAPTPVAISNQDGAVLFLGGMAPGEAISLGGDGALVAWLHLEVLGQHTAWVFVDCSRPLFAGLRAGDFEVLAGASYGGGALCPGEGGDDPIHWTDDGGFRNGDEGGGGIGSSGDGGPPGPAADEPAVGEEPGGLPTAPEEEPAAGDDGEAPDGGAPDGDAPVGDESGAPAEQGGGPGDDGDAGGPADGAEEDPSPPGEAAVPPVAQRRHRRKHRPKPLWPRIRRPVR